MFYIIVFICHACSVQEKTKSSEVFVGTMCYLHPIVLYALNISKQNQIGYFKSFIIGVCSSKNVLEVDLFIHNFPELDEHAVCYKYVNLLIFTKIIG